MFRRIGSRFSAFSSTSVALCAAAASEVSAASASSSSSQQQQQRKQRLNDNLVQVFEVPPRVDFRHVGKSITDGYFLRVQFTQAAVIIKRTAQNKAADERSIFSGVESFLQLPSTAVSRVLAVIEGDMDECQIVGRQFQGTFKASPDNAGGAAYVLTCKSAATQPAPKGNNNNNNNSNSVSSSQQIEWTATFDVADGILLQRFLKNSLHYMQGFYHSQQEE